MRIMIQILINVWSVKCFDNVKLTLINHFKEDYQSKRDFTIEKQSPL